jgi:hypothetical protein
MHVGGAVKGGEYKEKNKHKNWIPFSHNVLDWHLA